MPKLNVFAQESINEDIVNVVAYDKDYIEEMLKEHDGNFVMPLPYKEGSVEVPLGYSYSIVTNPYTDQSFYRVERNITTYGFKKFAIVNAFRYGGKALSIVLDVVSPSYGQIY